MSGSLFTISVLHDPPENSLLSTAIWINSNTEKFERDSPEMPMYREPNNLNDILVALNEAKAMTYYSFTREG